MEENVFQETEQTTIETNAFSSNRDPEYAKPKPCPPGHWKSIAAGGSGHYPGDNCNCGDGEGTTVSLGIIIYPLLLTAMLIMILVKFKPKH